jgi:Hg(II)-responsive transcriptional regulator
MSDNSTAFLTIGRLATKASVGVETVRYYQERGLLPIPHSSGGYRQYPIALVDRIRFIKRSQELGFSLDEISELLRLDEKIDKRTIRSIANQKIKQIQQKLDDLQQMQTTLRQLVHHCSHTGAKERCPIIASLSDTSQAQGEASN